MATLSQTTPPLGWTAQDFDLEGTDGKRHRLADLRGAKGTLVMFICNHCPYVKLIRTGLAHLGRVYQPKGAAIVGINSNDAVNYTDDNPASMRAEVATVGYTFPYLFDETQAVAKAYRAACTPDFFLFDGNLKLVYRGQFDGSRPGSGIPVTGEDLRAAMDAVLAGSPVAVEQKPSIGCNIKWKGSY